MNKDLAFDQFVFLTNGRVGVSCFQYMLEKGYTCRMLVLHPIEKGRSIEELNALANKHSIEIYNPKEFNNFVIENPKLFSNDLMISVFYGYIIPDSVLTPFKEKVNLHPAFLPYNKGAYTNIWSIIDKTPAGVTIHEMLPEIDKGAIIFQKVVPKYLEDTGKTLYFRLEEESISLFKEHISEIMRGKYPKIHQEGAGTFHLKKDVDEIDEINLDKKYVARDLINIIRARTFDNYKGAYIIDKSTGEKIYLKITLEREKQ